MKRALSLSLSLLVIMALVPVPAWATSEPSSGTAVPASGVVPDAPDPASGSADPNAASDGSGSAASSDAGADAASSVVTEPDAWTVYEVTPVSVTGNLLPSAIDTDGSVFNGTGWKDGYRLSSSGTDVSYDGYDVTGYIPCKLGDVVELQNITLVSGDGNQRISFYDAAFNHLGQINVTSATGVLGGVFDSNGNLVTFTIQRFDGSELTNVAYFRISAAGIDGSSSVAIEQNVIEEDTPVISGVTIWDKPFDEYTPTEGYLFLLFVLALGVCIFQLFKGGIW